MRFSTPPTRLLSTLTTLIRLIGSFKFDAGMKCIRRLVFPKFATYDLVDAARPRHQALGTKYYGDQRGALKDYLRLVKRCEQLQEVTIGIHSEYLLNAKHREDFDGEEMKDQAVQMGVARHLGLDQLTNELSSRMSSAQRKPCAKSPSSWRGTITTESS